MEFSKSWKKHPDAFDEIPDIDPTGICVMVDIFKKCSNSDKPQRINLSDILPKTKIGRIPKMRAISFLVKAGFITVEKETGKASLFSLTEKCKSVCESAIKQPEKNTKKHKSEIVSDSETDKLYMSLVNRSLDES